MHVNLPPILFYVIGLALVIFGGLRVKYLGAPRVPRRRHGDWDEDDSSADRPDDDEQRPVRGPEQLRHVRWGIIWILLGLFLLISTFLQVRRQMR